MPLMMIVLGVWWGCRRFRKSKATDLNRLKNLHRSFDDDDFGPDPLDDSSFGDTDEFRKPRPANRSEQFYSSRCLIGCHRLLLGTLLRLVHLPTVLMLTFVVRHIAFRRQQKYLDRNAGFASRSCAGRAT